MKKIIFLFAVVGLITLLISCDRKQKILPSGKTIKVGVIAPFTGIEKYKGEDGLKGIETILHMYPLLSNGDKIELILEDDKNETELTVKALEKLSGEENVAAILTLSTSASVLALNDIADNYKIPILALLATHQDIARNTSYVSQFCFDNIFQGMVAALYVRDELLIDRVAVFKNPESFHSTSLADEFIRKFESVGGKVTDVVSVNTGTEIDETILGVIRENGAELLYLPIQTKRLIDILMTIDNMGWEPEIMGSDGLFATALRQHTEEMNQLKGVLAIDFFTNLEIAHYTHFGRKVVREYKKLFKGRGSTYTGLGAEGMAVLLNAMDRCAKSDDRECINSMLRDTRKFEGLMGRISIKPNGKSERPLIVNVIKDGHMKFVVKVY